MNKRHAKRLLNVAKSLYESAKPEDFDMNMFGNYCGTPACALGHYAARKDLQRAFKFAVSEYEAEKNAETLKAAIREQRAPGHIYPPSIRDVETDEELFYDEPQILKHFGITYVEAEELFSSHGCENAQTADEAAEYIEKWVWART